MKIYTKLSEFNPKGNAIVTAGTFDGVHLGHQKIIQRLTEITKESNGESVLITFWPHPRLILDQNNENLKLLSTIDEKTELLSKMGIDHLLILPFNREFSELSSEQYIEEILIKGIGTKKLVIGYDHRFGRNREGGIDYLKAHADRFGLKIEEISKQEIDNLTISSTKIRNAIINGDVKTTKDLLGRNYDFAGNVVKGRQLGRTIGFPTANVKVQFDYKLIPKNGVYAVNVYLRDKLFNGIMNIGNRPTVDGIGRTQEVHIFNFDDDIYGENLKVEIIEYIRDEKKFDSIDALKAQIKIDSNLAKHLFYEI